MLCAFFATALEGVRTGRSLAKEPRLWLGLGLALTPPSYHFLLALRGLG